MDGRQGQRGVTVADDAWLGSIFGRPVFRVSVSDSADGVDHDAVFRGASPAFYYAKVPTRSVGAVSALTRIGFAVVDVNVTLEREARGTLPQGTPRDVSVRDSVAGQREAVLAIAESCFVYSRFHLDPLVPDTIANAVKRAWVDNYCLGTRGDRLLVATIDGEPAGFLAGIRAAAGDRRAWVIDLVGVHRGYQRRGVGLALVEAFTRLSREDADLVRVGTQVANVPSISLYEKCGFHVADSTYVLHAHA